MEMNTFSYNQKMKECVKTMQKSVEQCEKSTTKNHEYSEELWLLNKFSASNKHLHFSNATELG